jgi:hypothetical protein
MANDAYGVRGGSGSIREICALAAAALALTALPLAFYICLAPGLGPAPAAVAPGWPSVSC